MKQVDSRSTSNRLSRRVGVLVLEDGARFQGVLAGNLPTDNAMCAVGEVIFNTSMTGYQEIFTDPSYRGQIMTFTCPHIGNVGCNSDDVESDRVQVEALVCNTLEDTPSSFRAQQSLEEYMRTERKVILTDVDTRALTLHLRERGAMVGAIGFEEFPDQVFCDAISTFGSMEGKDYVHDVTCADLYSWRELPWSPALGRYPTLSENDLIGRPHVVAFDFGAKRNILRLLLQSGFRVTVVPASTTARHVDALKPDAVFLSNGPGDPAALGSVVAEVRTLLGRYPLFGICLGHQLLSLAAGGKTYKLKFGHRGANHPVIEKSSGIVDITVQNHGFAVEESSLTSGATVTHVNLNDRTVAGVELIDKRAFAVQFHPEASAGPRDASHLFGRFFDMVST